MFNEVYPTGKEKLGFHVDSGLSKSLGASFIHEWGDTNIKKRIINLKFFILYILKSKT
jgi:hypothetical protein